MSVPIQSFVDDPHLSQSLKSFVQKNPLYEVQFSDRLENKVSLKIRPKANILYGFSSSRPKSVFILHSHLLQTLKEITQRH